MGRVAQGVSRRGEDGGEIAREQDLALTRQSGRPVARAFCRLLALPPLPVAPRSVQDGVDVERLVNH